MSLTKVTYSMIDGALVNVRDFGAVGDGVADDTAAVQAAINAVVAIGGELIFTKGVYLISSKLNGNLSNDIKITFQNAKLLASSALDTFLLDLRSTVPYQNKATLTGSGTIDVSLIPVGVAGVLNAGTCVNLVNLSPGWKIDGIKFIAGVDYLDEKGDSGITPTDCKSGIISNNYFQGFYDNGIYITGGSSTGDEDNGNQILITGNYFFKNKNAVSSKRKSWEIKIIANQFDSNRYGVITLEVFNNEKQPGEGITVCANEFKNNVVAAFENRGGEGRHIITSNRIVDWGYNLDGTLVGSPRAAIKLRGGKNCVINDNLISMVDKSNDGHIGVAFENFTVDGVAYDNGDSLVVANQFANLTNGVREITEGDGNNKARDNHFLNTTINYIKLSASSSFYESNTVQNVSANFGSVAANDTSRITIPVSGIKGGAIVNMTRVGGDLVNARIQFAWRAVTDGIDIEVINSTASTLDLSAILFDVEYII